MCISDYRIGRMIRHFATTYNTTGAVNTVFNPNPSRVGIIVTPSVAALLATAATLVTFDTGAAFLRQGGGGQTLYMLLKDFGDVIQRGFTITAIGTAHAGVVTELLLPPELLDYELSRFRD